MITLWTDGSVVGNPGPGGFAVLETREIDGQKITKPVRLGRAKGNTTNIRMEGQAILEALRYADQKPCQIHTDSEFWVNVLTKWAPKWQKNGWRKSRGEIQNLDLVQSLYAAYQSSHAELIWVRGHVGTPENELADQWANKARRG